MTFQTTTLSSKRVLVVGAGLVGICSALRMAQAGLNVVLADKNMPASGASWAAAGMLAPAFEATNDIGLHENLFELCMRGAETWRNFAPWLQSYTDSSLDYAGLGSFVCAYTDAQLEELQTLETMCRQRNVPVRAMSVNKARALEPTLSENLRGVLLLPTDQQINNWAAIEALMPALAEEGVQILSKQNINRVNRTKTGWNVPGLGEFDNIVWTTGADASKTLNVDGKNELLLPQTAIVPVKGQMLAIATTSNQPKHVLRFGAGYVAPKSTRVIIGATTEWGVGDKRVVDQDIEKLHSDAAAICPALADGKVTMTWAGVRPGTPDHAPIIGHSAIDGIIVASGHYRNGILLSPLTGEIVTKLVIEQQLSKLESSFALDRFLPEQSEKCNAELELNK